MMGIKRERGRKNKTLGLFGRYYITKHNNFLFWIAQCLWIVESKIGRLMFI